MVIKEILQDLSCLANFDYAHDAKDTITFIKMEQRRLSRELSLLNKNKKFNEPKIIDTQFKLNLAQMALEQLAEGWVSDPSSLKQNSPTRKTSSNQRF